ncbi:hypothetical protein PIB30_080824 [Stylosanthes scabra]|uniref:Uncharacterized protein n=1 Tax=Stylosanthes scabra TaxID=79078 RepID=A0ABU6VTK6_9FABA|nr:hypothetical protein [Stylosanthes scabra]
MTGILVEEDQDPPPPPPPPSPPPSHRVMDMTALFPRRARYSSSSSERDSLSPRKRHEKRDPMIIPGPTPFSARIMQRSWFSLPKGFIRPTDMKYDGSTNSQKHLDAFEARMNLYKVEDAIWCRAFPISLSGPAMTLFNSLPSCSINSLQKMRLISAELPAEFSLVLAISITGEIPPVNPPVIPPATCKFLLKNKCIKYYQGKIRR